jgi:Fe-S-cluster containining protein
VLALLRGIDEGTARLQHASGLACPPGCGRCCLSPDVEASEVELRPLARELWERGEAERWLAVLAERAGDARCVLYEPDPADPARGRCAHYALRPSVCRLFGFASRRDKRGRLELAACKVHRETDPAAVARASESIATGLAVPELSSATATLGALDARGTARLLPINEAFRRALLAAGLERLLAAQQAIPVESEPPSSPPEAPPVAAPAPVA